MVVYEFFKLLINVTFNVAFLCNVYVCVYVQMQIENTICFLLQWKKKDHILPISAFIYLGMQWMNDLMVVKPTHNEQWNQSLADMENLKGRHVSIIDVMCATKTTHVEEGPHSSYLFIKYLGRDTTNNEIGL